MQGASVWSLVRELDPAWHKLKMPHSQRYLLIDYFPEPDLNCGTQDLCYSMHDATKQILHATTKIFYAITKTWNSQITK